VAWVPYSRNTFNGVMDLNRKLDLGVSAAESHCGYLAAPHFAAKTMWQSPVPTGEQGALIKSTYVK